MNQTYYTLFNGGQIYKVIVSPNNYIYVYYGEHFDTLLFEKQAQKVFVGKSPNYSSDYDGNSILIEIENYSYIYIGDKIITFMSYNPIVNYISPIGNSMVPYPYAIDDKGWVYLFVCLVVITSFSSNYISESDPYEYYWKNGIGLISSGQNHRSLAIKNFQNIQKFLINNTQYNLSYNPFPEEEYERLVHNFSSDLKLELTNGSIIPLDKTKFIQLMKDFESETESGLCKFDHMFVLHHY